MVLFYKRCRYCKSYEVYKTRPRTFFQAVIAPIFLLRPYICNRCLRRQLGFRFFSLATSKKNAGPSKT